MSHALMAVFINSPLKGHGFSRAERKSAFRIVTTGTSALKTSPFRGVIVKPRTEVLGQDSEGR